MKQVFNLRSWKSIDKVRKIGKRSVKEKKRLMNQETEKQQN